jgi:hypothetical protein
MNVNKISPRGLSRDWGDAYYHEIASRLRPLIGDWILNDVRRERTGGGLSIREAATIAAAFVAHPEADTVHMMASYSHLLGTGECKKAEEKLHAALLSSPSVKEIPWGWDDEE